MPIVSSLIGGGLGGWLALRAGKNAAERAHISALDVHDRSRRDAVRGFLYAVRAEIRALKKRYEEEDLSVILDLNPGDAFTQYFPIEQQSYFTVFDNGASLIGLVPDDDFRGLIVEIYLTARMIIDTHLYNNQLLSDRDTVINNRPRNDTYDRCLQDAEAGLRDYGHNIRVNYEQAKRLIQEFEEGFDGVISRLESQNHQCASHANQT